MPIELQPKEEVMGEEEEKRGMKIRKMKERRRIMTQL
jgi:hypothetical protein